jgi:hypothetical protein
MVRALVGDSPAAHIVLRRMSARPPRGGTDIRTPLMQALQNLNGPQSSQSIPFVVLLTDGCVSGERCVVTAHGAAVDALLMGGIRRELAFDVQKMAGRVRVLCVAALLWGGGGGRRDACIAQNRGQRTVLQLVLPADGCASLARLRCQHHPPGALAHHSSYGVLTCPASAQELMFEEVTRLMSMAAQPVLTDVELEMALPGPEEGTEIYPFPIPDLFLGNPIVRHAPHHSPFLHRIVARRLWGSCAEIDRARRRWQACIPQRSASPARLSSRAVSATARRTALKSSPRTTRPSQVKRWLPRPWRPPVLTRRCA